MSSLDVVVPCYRYAHFLRECVESVLSQSGVSVRVLIIDDASPDNTAEVAADLVTRDQRVFFTRHEENKGHIATYNEGLLEWASADYSLLLSADDVLAPGALARATRVMEGHSEVGMIYGMAVVIGENGPTKTTEPVSSDYRIIPGTHFLRFCCENCCNPVPTPTAIVRTELQHELGAYRQQFPHTGDLEMWMRFALRGPIGVLRSVQGYYRWHGENMGRRYYDQVLRDRREFIQVFEHTLAPLSGCLPESQQWVAAACRQLGHSALEFARDAFDKGNVAEYRLCLDFANEISPRSFPGILPWRLEVRRLLGQTLWQKARPTWCRIRGIPADPSPQQFYPQPGAQWGWWPGTYLS